MSRRTKHDRIQKELMRLLCGANSCTLEHIQPDSSMTERERKAYKERLRRLLRGTGVFYDGVGLQDTRALNVRWVTLDGTVVTHRYDAIMDMIRRGYTDEQIGEHFRWCKPDVLIPYRKAVAGTLTTGLYSERGGNPTDGIAKRRRGRYDKRKERTDEFEAVDLNWLKS